MSVVVAVAPGHDPAATTRYGAMLARSYRLPLVLAVVEPRGALAPGAAADLEQALAMAHAALPDGIEPRLEVRRCDDVRDGLLEICREALADRLVLGSSLAAEPGRIELGGVAKSLLHASPVPIMLVPREASPGRRELVPRITAAYNGSRISGELLMGAAFVAADCGADLRVASFAVKKAASPEAGPGLAVERMMLREWVADMRQKVEELAEQMPLMPEIVSVVAGSWDDALSVVGWQSGEVMMVGSSSFGSLAKVSLGSQAARMVRSSPVPVVVVPRHAREAYARS